MAANILPNPSLVPQTQTISQFQLARYVAPQNQIEALTEEQRELADELLGPFLFVPGLSWEPTRRNSRPKSGEEPAGKTS
jgi:hypothetical protein